MSEALGYHLKAGHRNHSQDQMMFYVPVAFRCSHGLGRGIAQGRFQLSFEIPLAGDTEYMRQTFATCQAQCLWDFRARCKT